MDENQDNSGAGMFDTDTNSGVKDTNAQDQNNQQIDEQGEKQYGEFLNTVPETYRDKPWFKDMVSKNQTREDHWKEYHNLLSVVGNKSAVPGEGASPEEIAKFHKASGVPDRPEDYKISPMEWPEEDKAIGEYIDKSVKPEVMDAVKKAAKENGIPDKALNALVKTFNVAQASAFKNEIIAELQKEHDLGVDFAQLGAQHFGGRYLEVMARAQQVLGEHIPPTLQPHLTSLDNKSLMVIAAVADSIYRKTNKEDRIVRQTSAADLGAMDKRAKELMNKPEFLDKNSDVYKETTRLFAQMESLRR